MIWRFQTIPQIVDLTKSEQNIDSQDSIAALTGVWYSLAVASTLLQFLLHCKLDSNCAVSVHAVRGHTRIQCWGDCTSCMVSNVLDLEKMVSIWQASLM